MKGITEQDGEAGRGDASGACGTDDAPLWRRLAWFVALWVAGVGVVAVVALLIRWVLPV